MDVSREPRALLGGGRGAQREELFVSLAARVAHERADVRQVVVANPRDRTAEERRGDRPAAIGGSREEQWNRQQRDADVDREHSEGWLELLDRTIEARVHDREHPERCPRIAAERREAHDNRGVRDHGRREGEIEPPLRHHHAGTHDRSADRVREKVCADHGEDSPDGHAGRSRHRRNAEHGRDRGDMHEMVHHRLRVEHLEHGRMHAGPDAVRPRAQARRPSRSASSTASVFDDTCSFS